MSGAVVTGAGCVVGACDAGPWLKVRKNRKFMGVQDELAVVAAGRALESAGLAGRALGPRAGLYLAVGYIPFEAAHVQLLLQNSVDGDGRFSMRRFASDALGALNPLLTFRCLSNMPAFHVSVNFDAQGPYLVTYPGPGQLYLALEEAVAALAAGLVDVALVGGVAHQRNFLVEHHFARLDPPVKPERLADAAGILVLEREGDAGGRARARLLELQIEYRTHHPFEEALLASEECQPSLLSPLPGGEGEWLELGPASLPVCVARRVGEPLRHRVASRDGFLAASVWGPA